MRCELVLLGVMCLGLAASAVATEGDIHKLTSAVNNTPNLREELETVSSDTAQEGKDEVDAKKPEDSDGKEVAVNFASEQGLEVIAVGDEHVPEAAEAVVDDVNARDASAAAPFTLVEILSAAVETKDKNMFHLHIKLEGNDHSTREYRAAVRRDPTDGTFTVEANEELNERHPKTNRPRGRCEVCVRLVMEKIRGSPELCTEGKLRKDNVYLETCRQVMEAIIHWDQNVVYWLYSQGCKRYTNDGNEYDWVRPCPPHAVCSWITYRDESFCENDMYYKQG